MENIENIAEVTNEAISQLDYLASINGQLNYIYSFLLFFVIVVLCYFAYKFFDMFFKI